MVSNMMIIRIPKRREARLKERKESKRIEMAREEEDFEESNIMIIICILC